MSTPQPAFEEVRTLLATSLGLDDRAASLTPNTPLLDSLPELDSMAVLKVIVAIEEHFGITIDNDEVTGDLFETLGTLAAFIEQKVA